MKAGKVFAVIVLWGVLIVNPGTASAATGASILYQETDLGNGLWQYDYTFYNTSDTGEFLFSVWFDLDREAQVTGVALPDGWMGATVWDGTNITAYLDPVSMDLSYDIAASGSLGGFSFMVDYRAGGIPYTAYFDDHNGGESRPVAGTSEVAIVPEPISLILFLSGGAVLAAARYGRQGRR